MALHQPPNCLFCFFQTPSPADDLHLCLSLKFQSGYWSRLAHCTLEKLFFQSAKKVFCRSQFDLLPLSRRMNLRGLLCPPPPLMDPLSSRLGRGWHWGWAGFLEVKHLGWQTPVPVPQGPQPRGFTTCPCCCILVSKDKAATLGSARVCRKPWISWEMFLEPQKNGSCSVCSF